MRGAPGVLAVELAGEGGRLALVRDPGEPSTMLQVHAEGRTVALRLPDDVLRRLQQACGESLASAAPAPADDWHRETLPMPL
jgi:hypothetical protein